MDEFKVSKKVLCDFLTHDSTRNKEQLLEYLKSEYKLDCEQVPAVRKKLAGDFIPYFMKKWKSVFYKKESFNNNFKTWMSSDFIVDFSLGNKGTRGRPNSGDFEEGSTSTKRRKLVRIEESFSEIEIQEAFLRILRTSGRKSIANAISSLLDDTEQNERENSPIIPFTVIEALALTEEAKLTKSQYKLIYIESKKRNADIFPPYNGILEAKSHCYPELMTVTETGIKITTQAIIDHTVTRLLKDPSITLPEVKRNRTVPMMIRLKYGCDGTSGFEPRKQKFTSSVADITDESVFTVAMVPLELCLEDTNNTVVWKNPQPSSTMYCRPMQYYCLPETKERTKLVVSSIKEDIKKLHPTRVVTEKGIFVVKADMQLTMVDGKVCQALTETPSAASCYICGATPKEMNDLNRVQKKPEKEENFQFGLSTLHAWICFLNLILHIAYRLDFKVWIVKDDDLKEKMKKSKKRIQLAFREKTGLIVDTPKQGSGNSNDGNTARRFFADPELASKITGVNQQLIERFAHILHRLASGETTNLDDFQKYTSETARLYVRLYSWYKMPSAVHKILIHGANVMRHFHLPIGQYSEEAAEARNKDLKRFRKFHSRKISREATNEDVGHKLLVSSDPLVAHFRRKFRNSEINTDCQLFTDDAGISGQ